MSRYLPPRSFAVKGINGLGRAAGAIGWRPIRLDEPALLAMAEKSTGLGDWGDDAFRRPLGLLLDDYERESHLTLSGRLITQRDVLRTLENRLRLVEDRKRHPGMAAEEIRRPLFVVGLPRTGSTILHELLAMDPENRVPLTWEIMWPSPPPEAAHYRDDPRIARAATYLKAVDQLIPGFRAMHRMGAELPQECCMIMNHDFMSMQWHLSNRVPSYEAWFEAQDLRPIYASHRRQLQHLQHRCPADRWVLKSPQHLWNLDALLDVYPDASIVQTHRDPVRVAASLASLATLLRGMCSDDVDPVEVGADWAARLADGLDRAMTVRRERTTDAGSFYDLHFRSFLADPIAAVDKIYGHFGWRLSALAEDRMRAHLAENPQNKDGRHEYTLTGAGLDLEHERQRFAAYERAYGIGPELDVASA